LVLLQAGVVVAGAFLKPEEVAIYSAAAATAGFVSLPVYAGAARGAPKFAALHTQHRLPELQKLFSDIVRWALWPSLAIALAFGVGGGWILRLFGPGFERGYPVLLVLTLGLVSGAFVGPAANLLTMTGHQVSTARVQTTCALLAVIAGLLATPIWGVIGTAAAFASAIVLMNAWLMLSARRDPGIVPFPALARR
jgi:O-antigen/teichoic acid export membrane protein